MGGGIFEFRGELVKGQIVLDIFLHVMNHLGREGYRLLVPGIGGAVLLQAGERGEEMIEAHRGIEHVFADISHREAPVDFLEELQPVLQTGVFVGLDRLRIGISGEETPADPSPEMKPIDSPWVGIVCPEGIGRMVRDENILVLMDYIFFPLRFIPSFSVRAIDEHTIIASLFLMHIMVFYVREIAYHPQIKVPDERVLGIFLQ